MNLFTKQKQTHRLREHLGICMLCSYGYQRGRVAGGGIVREFGIKKCTLLYLKRITNKDILYSTGNSAQCYITT